jgi:hypothetical protein
MLVFLLIPTKPFQSYEYASPPPLYSVRVERWQVGAKHCRGSLGGGGKTAENKIHWPRLVSSQLQSDITCRIQWRSTRDMLAGFLYLDGTLMC